jgi:hypothetical protein
VRNHSHIYTGICFQCIFFFFSFQKNLWNFKYLKFFPVDKLVVACRRFANSSVARSDRGSCPVFLAVGVDRGM